jgi:hypothetical protein
MNDKLEKKRQRTENVVKVLGLGIAGFIVAPYIYIAIQGLIGMAIAAIVSLAIIFATPSIAMKLANWRLKLIKSEAMRNPVETLQNIYNKRELELARFREEIKNFAAQLMNFKSQVEQYVKDGIDDANVYVEQLRNMHRLKELRETKYAVAKEKLEEFGKTIEITDRKWKMGLSAMKMNEIAGALQGDAFEKICVETSLESVQLTLNTAFAELEISLLDDDKEKAKKMFADKTKQQQLTNANTSVIDVAVEDVPEVDYALSKVNSKKNK